MWKKIFRAIKQYDTIVIARHIGVDPDAMASQIALRDSIRLTFPSKKVFAIGSGSVKFQYLGKLDKTEEWNNALLIVLDTPDRKRVDAPPIEQFAYSLKIDHHPFVEEFCNEEYIDAKASSTCQIIMELLENTKLKVDTAIAEKLFLGLVSDTNRFLFENATAKTFHLVGNLLEKYPLPIADLYQNIYMRPLSEVRFQGYIEENLKVTENGVGYIIITNQLIGTYHVDSASAGNIVNNLNYIDELLVWMTITEDIKNDNIRINIRSRGPEVNRIAEKYNGGGHHLASGARVKIMAEVDCLIEELDQACKHYLERIEKEERNENQ